MQQISKLQGGGGKGDGALRHGVYFQKALSSKSSRFGFGKFKLEKFENWFK